jgi:ketosteroid isomerase-like protein
MHPHAQLLEKLYTSLNNHDHEGMAACYHDKATFKDIAFDLEGKKQIRAMWAMIAESPSDLRATFKVLHADDKHGLVDLVDDYFFDRRREDPHSGRPVHNVIRSEFSFEDGKIICHRDRCSALKWGLQALGPIKGFLSWIVPPKRKATAMSKLKDFVTKNPEYDWRTREAASKR